MKLYIKNMVCERCKMVISNLLQELEINYLSLELGELVLPDDTIESDVLDELTHRLMEYGFEVLESPNSRLVEKIKKSCNDYLEHLQSNPDTKLSAFINSKVHKDYRYLSNLFSSVENMTIEQYFILLRLEKVKEQLIYNEDSLTMIADKYGFSSSAHLSTQFKKVTGLTPSHFRDIKKDRQRISLDKL